MERDTLIGVRADGESVLVIGKDNFSFERIDIDVMFFHLLLNFII